MRKNILIIATLLCLIGFATACSKDDCETSERLTPNSTLADTLIGNWNLVKVTGGAHGQGYEVTEPQILKIFNQNPDLSFNYEWWAADTLMILEKMSFVDDSESNFGVCYRVVNMADTWFYHFSLRFYKGKEQLLMELVRNSADGYHHHFKKTSGRR